LRGKASLKGRARFNAKASFMEGQDSSEGQGVFRKYKCLPFKKVKYSSIPLTEKLNKN